MNAPASLASVPVCSSGSCCAFSSTITETTKKKNAPINEFTGAFFITPLPLLKAFKKMLCAESQPEAFFSVIRVFVDKASRVFESQRGSHRFAIPAQT